MSQLTSLTNPASSRHRSIAHTRPTHQLTSQPFPSRYPSRRCPAPSTVAQSLAAVIGATARKDGYLEGGGWRVSWCVGHLAGLADADSYDLKYAKWRQNTSNAMP